MNYKIMKINRFATIISVVMFLGGLIWLSVVYKGLADNIGIHFDGDGAFDMIDEKKYAFYPFIVSGIVLGICILSAWLAGKVKLGMKVNEQGDRKVRNSLVLLIDILEVGIVFFFSLVWNYSVVNQVKLNIKIPRIIVLVDFVLFNVFIVYIIAVRIKHSSKNN